MRPWVVSGLLISEDCVKVSDERAEGWRALHGREDEDTEVVGVPVPGVARQPSTLTQPTTGADDEPLAGAA